MAEALRFTCVYSNDAAQKKRKRWADGTCVYSEGVLRVQSETTERVASARFTQAEADALLRVDHEFRAGVVAIQIIGRVQASSSAAGGAAGSADAGAACGGAATAQLNAGVSERRYAPLATATNRAPAPAAARAGMRRGFVCRPVAAAEPGSAAPDTSNSSAASAAQSSKAEASVYAAPANMQAQHLAAGVPLTATHHQALQITDTTAVAAAAMSTPAAKPLAAARKPFVLVRRSLGTAASSSSASGRTAAIAVSAAVPQSAVGVLTFGSPAAFAPGSLLLQVSLRAVLCFTHHSPYCHAMCLRRM
jgi:Protein of unknown function (DUF2439)